MHSFQTAANSHLEYHGFPMDGILVGSKVGCASPPVQSYGAVEIVCA
jgi:hypothetical protein